MNKSASALRILSIVINAIFLIAIASYCISSPPEEGYIIMATVLILTPAVSLPALLFYKKLLFGAKGISYLCFALVFNVLTLMIFALVISQSGMPPEGAMAFQILMWLISPLLTCTTLFFIRSQVKLGKSLNCDSISCPNCGTEIAV